MKASITRIVRVTLDMEEQHARWLKAYMQNPPFGDESIEDAEMRRSLFDAINDLLNGELNNGN